MKRRRDFPAVRFSGRLPVRGLPAPRIPRKKAGNLRLPAKDEGANQK
jgi:hypothetical protein